MLSLTLTLRTFVSAVTGKSDTSPLTVTYVCISGARPRRSEMNALFESINWTLFCCSAAVGIARKWKKWHTRKEGKKMSSTNTVRFLLLYGHTKTICMVENTRKWEKHIVFAAFSVHWPFNHSYLSSTHHNLYIAVILSISALPQGLQWQTKHERRRFGPCYIT